MLILDWDVHHGDGTQAITYADRDILLISLHRSELSCSAPLFLEIAGCLPETKPSTKCMLLMHV